MPYKDPEKRRARGRRYARQWRAAHPEATKASNRRNYVRHLADRRQRGLTYYYANRDDILVLNTTPERKAIKKASAKRHPEAARNAQQQRRARHKRVTRRDFTARQRVFVLTMAHGVCAYCPYYKPECAECHHGTHILCIDHITPIIDGGNHTLWNVVASCHSCNRKKWVRPIPGPVQPWLLTCDAR
jgi:5-methylcytosine-specific restriction endonuclease McrA